MKKTLTGLLALLASCTLFSACFTGTAGSSTSETSSPSSSVGTTSEETTSESTSEETTVDPHEEALALAKDFVYGSLVEKDLAVSKDYTLIKTFYSGILDEELTITWTVDVTEGVTLVEGETEWKVDVDEFAKEDIFYTLTATLADSDGHTASFTLDRKVLKAADVVPEKITEAPVEGEAYKLYMYQEQKKNDLYFIGEMNNGGKGYYLNTNNASKGESYEVSVDVFVEKVEGKDAYYLTFTNKEGAKKYIGITNTYNNNKFHVNAIIRDTVDTTLDAGEVVKTFEYTWNTDLKTLVATLEGVKSGEDQATTETKTDTYFLGTSGTFYTFGAMSVSEAEGAYVGCLVKMVNKSEVSAEDKLTSEKAALNVTTAFSGAVSYELPTQGTTYGDVAIAWAVKSGDATLTDNVLNVANPTAETKIVLTATFTCGEATATQDVTVTVYPKSPVTQVTELQEGVAYTVYMYQTTNAKNYYFTGKMDGKYLATTDDITKAADVYIENVEGGFKVYVMEGEAKSYIALEAYQAEGKSYISANVSMNATGSVFTYNSQFLTLCCKAALADNSKSDVFFLGTYGTYTTMSASGSYYMTADKLGTEQFYATFGLIDESAITPPEGGDVIVPEVTTTPIATILASADGEYQAEGTVVAVTAKSFVLKDSTGMMLVYLNAAPSVNVGDKVTVKGTTSVYGMGKQFGAGSEVTFVEAGSVGMQIATSLTAADVDAYAAVETVTIKYVEVTATLSINASKGYYNLTVDGATAMASISYPTDAMKAVLAELDGKEISVEGYFIGVTGSSTKYVQIMAVNVKATDAGIGDDKEDEEECKHNYENGVCTECGEADPDYKPEGGDEKPVVPEDAITTSVVVADYAAANQWANATGYSDLYLDDCVTASVAGTAVGDYGLNTGKYYADGSTWRIYQSESATLTIWVEKGLTIHSVKITYAIKNTGILLLDGEQIESDVVVEGIENSFVTFNVGATDSSKTNGQVQIKAIEVVYSGVEVEEKPGEGEGEECKHNYVEGVCTECGAADPDYVPEVNECEHNYVEGVCTECGAADPDYVAPVLPEYAPMTIAEAMAAAVDTKVEISGTVTEIYQAWSEQYGNISVYISDGTARIIVFRASVMLGVGDVITVKGVITAYNEVNQIAQGATVEITEKHTCSTYTDATCAAPATCTVCGIAKDDVLADHNYVDGTCTVCGNQEGVATITASKTIAELITSEGWTNTTTKQQFKLDDVVTVKVNGGSNTGKAYDGNHIRIYATDSPAGTLTISVAEGYELVSVKVSAKTGTYAFLYVAGTTTDICNATTVVSGTSVVLNSVKNGSDGKQVRITAIEVVYKKVASAPESDQR